MEDIILEKHKFPMISIVIPCFNEKEGINYLSYQLFQLITKLKEKIPIELIFVDDGSDDNTYSLLKEKFSSLKKVKFLKHKKNLGIGAALKTGFKEATGDIVATIDSDCTCQPIEIIEMLKLLDEKTDIVSASPYYSLGKVEGVSQKRFFLSVNLSRLYNFILRQNIYTYTNIFRIYRKSALTKITFAANDFVAPAEILILSLFKRLKIKEYPLTLSCRKFGQSKMKVTKVIFSHLKFLIKIIFFILWKKGKFYNE